MTRGDVCIACGLPVPAHFDSRNEMVGCVGAAQRLAPVDEGRLFTLKLKHNRAARLRALASVAPATRGQFRATIGGRVRGRVHLFSSRHRAEAAVHEHYNALMLAFVTRAR